MHVHHQLHHIPSGDRIIAVIRCSGGSPRCGPRSCVRPQRQRGPRGSGNGAAPPPLDTLARLATTVTVLPDQPTSAKQPTAASNNASRVARLRSCFGPFGEGSIVVTLPSSVAAAPETTRCPLGILRREQRSEYIDQPLRIGIERCEDPVGGELF